MDLDYQVVQRLNTAGLVGNVVPTPNEGAETRGVGGRDLVYKTLDPQVTNRRGEPKDHLRRRPRTMCINSAYLISVRVLNCYIGSFRCIQYFSATVYNFYYGRKNNKLVCSV